MLERRAGPSTFERTVLLPLILGSALTPGLHAQGPPVEGQLVTADGSEPVVGAVVYLLDEELRGVRAILSDSVGAFRFEAPRPGLYQLRIERIGFESSRIAPFEVPASGSRDIRVALQVRPIELRELSVTADRVCDIDADGGDLMRVWTEARKALAVTLLSEASGDLEFDLEVREKLYGAQLQVVEELLDTLTSSQTSAFGFVAVDELSDAGWGRLDDGVITDLYGPSPEILLSSWFTEHHCLGLAPPSPDSLIGLEFASMEGDLQIGIEGTFWMTNRSWLLRGITFRFTGPPELAQTQVEGGSVALRTGDWGSWFVDSWSIRVPVRELRRRGLFGGGRPVLVGYLERGGRVLEWRR